MTASIIDVDEQEDTGSPGADEPPSDTRRNRAIALVGLAALAIPIIAVVIVALTRTWYPPSDHALIEIRTRDVGGPLTPVLGAYSRLGWNHPGPLLFWVLALPYRLAGATTQGLLLGATAINTASIVGCLVLARRRGGAVLTVLTGLALAALVRGYGAAFLFHIWNPDLPVFPTALLVLAAWSAIEGDLRVLPVTIAVSCFTWQAHLGYLPVSGGLAAVATAAAAVHLVRARRTVSEGGAPPAGAGRVGLLVGATALTAAVCLAPLAVEQATNQPGNIRLIVDSFLHADEEIAGLDRALRVSAKHLAPAGTWLTGDDPAEPITAAAAGGRRALLILPALAVAVAALMAARLRLAAPARLLALTASCAVVAGVAVGRTTGDPYNYLFNWFRPISALLWLSVGWIVVLALRAAPVPAVRRPVLARAGWVVTAAATVALAVSSLGNGVGLDFQEDESAVKVRALAPGTLGAVQGHERVYLRTVGGWCAGELGNGLALQLIRSGTEVVVEDRFDIAYGRERVGDDVAPTVELLCGPVARDAIGRLPIRPVATHSILADDEEGEWQTLQEQARVHLAATGREDLVREVGGTGFGDLVRHGWADTGLAPAELARFLELSDRAHHSAAVFFRPFGPNEPV